MRRCPGNEADARIGRWIASALAVAGFLVPAYSGDPIAESFGQLPQIWGARLSPSGAFISFLHMDEKLDVPFAYVSNAAGEIRLVMASPKNKFDLQWCDWANDERLLCGFVGIDRVSGTKVGTTRLAAVNQDGSDIRVLLQNQLKRRWGYSQFQDRIIDWLPDDDEHVLIAVPDAYGMGVSRLNIYDGGLRVVLKPRANVRYWLSDGRGEVRARYYMSTEKWRWDFRLPGSRSWQTLAGSDLRDLDATFSPVGFGEDPNELLFFATKQGRKALFARNLLDGEDRLVYSHDAVDLSGTYSLGKFRRLVAVGYETDKPHLHFFDPAIEQITDSAAAALEGQRPAVIDESWDRSVYLLNLSSDQDPGRYYRLDLEARQMEALWLRHPFLKDWQLAQMQAISIEARDGVRVPAYLTMPVNGEIPLPLIVLPHGGPESRDYWGFDWLAQSFAARGFAVLQVNYRGSGGYGDDWAGIGGFRAWRLAVSDISDGVAQLIDDGIADADRMCIVGWSYGGYAALMSSIEEPDLYRCAVSIAGVTDPRTLIEDSRDFINSRAVREFVGTDDEVIDAGSPLRRAREIEVPVMLIHGDEDLNVSVAHSKKMHKALKKRGLSRLTVYDDAEHDIWSNEYRIDMLTRVGEFVDKHTAVRAD